MSEPSNASKGAYKAAYNYPLLSSQLATKLKEESTDWVYADALSSVVPAAPTTSSSSSSTQQEQENDENDENDKAHSLDPTKGERVR